MSHDNYAAQPGLNASAIKRGAVSMLHMHHYLTSKDRADTPAMRWGRLVHSAILEPDTFFADLAIYDGIRRGKAWDEVAAEHAPDSILKADELADLTRISAAVHANREAHRMIEASEHEVSLTWEHPHIGACKARIDGLSEVVGGFDLKSTAAILPARFAGQFFALGYDLQLGWYDLGAAAAGLKVPWHVISVEAKPPHAVIVYRMPEYIIQEGQKRAVEIAQRYRICEHLGVYPGIAETVLDFEPPAWMAGGMATSIPDETINASEL